MIKTDLNERERERFAEMSRATSKAATALAEALGTDDDTKLIVSFMLFSLTVSSLSELQKIIMASAEKMKDERKTEGHPLTLDEMMKQL